MKNRVVILTEIFVLFIVWSLTTYLLALKEGWNVALHVMMLTYGWVCAILIVELVNKLRREHARWI